jgi:hypothetical protein
MGKNLATKGTVISDTYTIIQRPQGHLEFYEHAKGLHEKRTTPDFLLTPDEAESLTTFLTIGSSAPNTPIYQERRDKRFFSATITALKDIQDRAMQQPPELRYSAAYGILRGYFEVLLTNFAEAFTTEQLAEIRIVLDQLSASTLEDTHLSDKTRSHLARLAKTLREAGEEA